MLDATRNLRKTLSWALASSALSLCSAAAADVAVVGVRVGQHTDMTRVVIDMDASHGHKLTAADGVITIALADARTAQADYRGAGVVRQVRVDGAGHVTIDTAAPVSPRHVFTLPPDEEYPHHRLVLDLPQVIQPTAQQDDVAAYLRNIAGQQWAAAEPQSMTDAAPSAQKSAAELWAEEEPQSTAPESKPAENTTAGKSAAELWAEESEENPPSGQAATDGASDGKSAADLWAEEGQEDTQDEAAPTSSGLFEGWSFTGYAEVEGRYFPQNARELGPKHQTGSVAAEPSISYAWAGGKQRVTFTPFGRADTNDRERSHADIRELKWIGVFDRVEIRAGIDKLFWGVTESVHLVDVINQDDALEDIDREDKLGQPLVSLAYDGDFGIVTAYAMPYFRDRQFAGMDGRPRGPLPILKNEIYGDGDNRWRFDWALRYAHAFGPFDVALSHFHGRRRDPILLPTMTGSGMVLVPYYDVIDQTGLELQATLGAMLLKFEGIRKAQPGENQLAAAGGFEYTFYNIVDGASDLGVLAEYLWDERGRNIDNPFQDDVFVALRWTANDVASTTLLAGAIFDTGTSAKFINIEGSRRFGEHWKLSVDARLLVSVPPTDPLYPFSDDDFIQVKLQYYF